MVSRGLALVVLVVASMALVGCSTPEPEPLFFGGVVESGAVGDAEVCNSVYVSGAEPYYLGGRQLTVRDSVGEVVALGELGATQGVPSSAETVFLCHSDFVVRVISDSEFFEVEVEGFDGSVVLERETLASDQLIVLTTSDLSR